VLAVLDVAVEPRMKWVVADEGKGLDWVLEVHVTGRRGRVEREKVQQYAHLGIPEYFIFDRGRSHLLGFWLSSTDARVYQPIISQSGSLYSQVLDLELSIDADRLCFSYGSAPLPDAAEVMVKLEAMVDHLVAKREDAWHQVESERRRAENERNRAEAAETRVAELEAELARLKGEGA